MHEVEFRVGKKLREVESQAGQYAARAAQLNPERLAHMPDPAAHAQALAGLAEALTSLDQRLGQRFGEWEKISGSSPLLQPSSARALVNFRLGSLWWRSAPPGPSAPYPHPRRSRTWRKNLPPSRVEFPENPQPHNQPQRPPKWIPKRGNMFYAW